MLFGAAIGELLGRLGAMERTGVTNTAVADNDRTIGHGSSGRRSTRTGERISIFGDDPERRQIFRKNFSRANIPFNHCNVRKRFLE
jgi:hypothetical protein